MVWIRVGTERVDAGRGRSVRAVCAELTELPLDDEEEEETPSVEPVGGAPVEVDLREYWVDAA